MVRDRQPCHRGVPAQLDANHSARGTILCGVAKEVLDHLLQPQLIAGYNEHLVWTVQVHRLTFQGRLHLSNDALYKRIVLGADAEQPTEHGQGKQQRSEA
jgi:hypothetical protein